MCRPPALAVEKPPEEELAGAGVQAMERATCDSERDDAGRFANDLDDAQSMPEGSRERREHAKDDDRCERRGVQPTPVISSDVVVGELVPGRDLMEPGERDPPIRREVNRVPRLVAKATPDNHDRTDDDGDQQS